MAVVRVGGCSVLGEPVLDVVRIHRRTTRAGETVAVVIIGVGRGDNAVLLGLSEAATQIIRESKVVVVPCIVSTLCVIRPSASRVNCVR